MMNSSMLAVQFPSHRTSPAGSFRHGPSADLPISLSPVIGLADGQIIYSFGEAALRIYRVEWGAVRLYRLLANGRRHILAFHLTGEWFGLQNDDVRRFSAEAVGSTALRSLGLKDCSELSGDLLPSCLRSLAWSHEHQLVMGRQGAVERLAAFLSEMSDRSGGQKRFELVMPRVDIADYLGLTVETVSRALTKLRTGNIIRLYGKRGVEVLDRDALLKICA